MNLFAKNAILSKLESTYGTDATPTGAADALLCVVRSFRPMVAGLVQREAELGAALGRREQLVADYHSELGLDIEMVGSGTLGTAPAWGKELKTAGFSETVNAGVSVVYAPVSSGFSSASKYVWRDGTQHKMLGVYGSKLSHKMMPRGVPYFALEYMGLYGGVADAAFPALTQTAWKAPIAVNNANTSAFAVQSFSGKLYDIAIDYVPKVVYRNLVGGEDLVVVNRECSGSVVIEEPTVATKDFWTALKNATLGTLSITHGIVAGYKVKVDLANVQVKDVTPENRDGVAALKIDLHIPTSAGNDEVTITSL